jgi:hypothetical protein
MEEDDIQEEVVSGPFCPHWGDPVDCQEPCAVCDHPCGGHANLDEGECRRLNCGCSGFED